MNIKVCDVCYQERDDNSDFLRLISKSTYRISYKKPATSQRIALDVCGKHSNFFKIGVNNYEDAVKKYEDLRNKAPFSIK